MLTSNPRRRASLIAEWPNTRDPFAPMVKSRCSPRCVWPRVLARPPISPQWARPQAIRLNPWLSPAVAPPAPRPSSRSGSREQRDTMGRNCHADDIWDSAMPLAGLAEAANRQQALTGITRKGSNRDDSPHPSLSLRRAVTGRCGTGSARRQAPTAAASRPRRRRVRSPAAVPCARRR